MDDRPTDEQLRATLRHAYGNEPFPDEQIRSRLRDTFRIRAALGVERRGLAPWFIAVTSAAAAIALFVAGAEYGRRSAVATPVADPAVAVGAPIAIQSAGSAYVARLAEFSEQAQALTDDERAEAREVAFAILYAATVELLREAEDDDLLAAIAQMIFSRRQSLRNPGPAGTVWF